ncbi:MAG: hypothetical protein Q9202_005750 [Teloschistes flavicans]
MFSTLRYTADSTKEAICIEQASNPPGQSHGQQHSACNHCRAKKLKCIGENNSSGDRKKTGTCDRCRSKGIECVFPEPSPAKGSKRRRSSQSSKETQKSRGTSYSSSGSVSTAASTPPPMDKAGALTLKPNPIDLSAASGSVPMDLNFDLGAPNEFMDLLDIAHPELGTDENRAQYDFSSLKPLPDDFLGFDFDSDAADSPEKAPYPPILRPASCHGLDLGVGEQTADEMMLSSVNNNSDDISMLTSTVSPMHLSSPDSPIPMQQLLADPMAPFRPNAPPISSPTSTASATTPTTSTPTTTKSKLSAFSALPGSIVAQRNRESANFIHHTASGASSCRCMSTALDILEVLEIKNSKMSYEAIDGILSFKKRALNQCNVMLECQGCNSHSQFMMLLVVICDKMVASFERLSLSCREVHQQIAEVGDMKKAEGFTIVDGKSLFVGEYEVDLDEERCYLVRQLVMLQLRNLATFELRLKGIANGWSWDAHKTMLATIDKRLQDTAANIRRLDAGSSSTTRMIMT